jgi:hypothetical protein
MFSTAEKLASIARGFTSTLQTWLMNPHEDSIHCASATIKTSARLFLETSSNLLLFVVILWILDSEVRMLIQSINNLPFSENTSATEIPNNVAM